MVWREMLWFWCLHPVDVYSHNIVEILKINDKNVYFRKEILVIVVAIFWENVFKDKHVLFTIF